MEQSEFQAQVEEGDEWICLGAGGQEITVRVDEKHDDWALCTILSEPNKGNEHDFGAGHFHEPA